MADSTKHQPCARASTQRLDTLDPTQETVLKCLKQCHLTSLSHCLSPFIHANCYSFLHDSRQLIINLPSPSPTSKPTSTQTINSHLPLSACQTLSKNDVDKLDSRRIPRQETSRTRNCAIRMGSRRRSSRSTTVMDVLCWRGHHHWYTYIHRTHCQL